MATLPGDYTEISLRPFGINAHKFNKVILGVWRWPTTTEITVKFSRIDVRLATMGGTGMADEYINHIVRFGHWKDGGIRLDGRGS